MIVKQPVTVRPGDMLRMLVCSCGWGWIGTSHRLFRRVKARHYRWYHHVWEQHTLTETQARVRSVYDYEA